MVTWLRNGLAVTLVALCVAFAAPAWAAPPGGALLHRTITFADLGFAGGIQMLGISGGGDYYFPVPDQSAIRSLDLVLPYRSASAIGSRRSLLISVAGKPVFTQSLPTSFAAGRIEVPISSAAAQNGFVHVRLDYSGAITDNRCIDQRISGAYLSIDATGGLAETVAATSLRTVSGLLAAMPRQADIIVSGSPSEAQAAAALTIAAGDPQARIVHARTPAAGGNWQRASIAIGNLSDPALSVRGNEYPELVVGGADPAAAARLLNARWNTILGTKDVTSVEETTSGQRADRLYFDELNGDTSILRVVDRDEWNVSLPATRIPAGRSVSGLSLDVAVANDGGAIPPVVSVTMNGVLLGSTEAAHVTRVHLDEDLPSGILAGRNTVTVAVTRQIAQGNCLFSPQGYDAQLLPSSYFTLSDAGPVTDFFQMAPQFAGGATVVVPNGSELGGTSTVLQGLIGGETPLLVRYGGAPPTGNYVWISDTQPPDSNPPIRFDRGTVQLTDRHGATILSADAVRSQTLAQLLAVGNRFVLWIRPGTDFNASRDVSGDSPPLLDRGDEAFIQRGRTTLAFSTARDRLIDIQYPEQFDLGAFFSRYRLWLIALAWLVVTVAFLQLLRGIYRSRKKDDSS
jgi:hypothetical protein